MVARIANRIANHSGPVGDVGSHHHHWPARDGGEHGQRLLRAALDHRLRVAPDPSLVGGASSGSASLDGYL